MNRSLERRHRSRWRTSLFTLVLAVAMALASVAGLSGGAAAAASDYTQSIAALNATQAQILFTPTTPALYVDVHYLINGAGQQNFRMTNNAGTWQQTISSLTTGTAIEYWFTYEKSGPQFDTPHFTFTQGGTGGGGGPGPGAVA